MYIIPFRPLADEQAESARIQVLNEQIRMGWGDIIGRLIPDNWRDRSGPGVTGEVVMIEVDGEEMWIDPLLAERIGLAEKVRTLDDDAARALRNELGRIADKATAGRGRRLVSTTQRAHKREL